jgi:hypothetical protein
VIQGGDPAVLTIAPKDAKSKDYTDFRNKLVVMLQSKDAEPPTEGTALEVAGRPGFLTVQDDVQMLTYQGEGDRWLVIQAPTSLGWDGKQIAEFAAGVEVLGNAEAGLG